MSTIGASCTIMHVSQQRTWVMYTASNGTQMAMLKLGLQTPFKLHGFNHFSVCTMLCTTLNLGTSPSHFSTICAVEVVCYCRASQTGDAGWVRVRYRVQFLILFFAAVRCICISCLVIMVVVPFACIVRAAQKETRQNPSG